MEPIVQAYRDQKLYIEQGILGPLRTVLLAILIVVVVDETCTHSLKSCVVDVCKDLICSFYCCVKVLRTMTKERTKSSTER